MKVLTEATLRGEFRNKYPEKYVVDSKVIITPSARQFLKEKNIQLIIEENKSSKEEKEKEEKHNRYEALKVPDNKILPKYVSYYSDGCFEEKPEYMTQIYGNKLVFKDDKRIIFRGKLDSFQSSILELQVAAFSKNLMKLVEELGELLDFTRKVLRAEVLDEELKDITWMGLDDQQLREMSHHPHKHFGVEHILPAYEMGEILIRLNALRSQVREVEITAITAFRRESKVERLDIIRALNRLSSGIYIMMCRYRAGLYNGLG